MVENALEVVGELRRKLDSGHLRCQFSCTRPAHSLARNSLPDEVSHLLPGDRFSRGRDAGVTILRNAMEIVASLVLFRFLRNCLEYQCVRCGAGALGGGRNALLELLG